MMRCMPALCAVLALALILAGCGKLAIPDGGQSPAASTLGPEGPPAEADASTLSARVAAGVDWLWASYTRLKDYVDPAIEPMRKLYVTAQEALVAAKAGDWLKALGLYVTARELVSEIAKVEGS